MRWPALLMAAACGLFACEEAPTEIVLVVDSDLRAPEEISSLQIIITPSLFPPGSGLFAPLGREPFGVSFPATLGLVPADDSQELVGVSVVAMTLQGEVAVGRAAREVRFVRGETRMLRLFLARACACMGTSCPSPGTPGCEDLVAPQLPPFDEQELAR